jgi:hypothetical protein
MPLGSHVRRFWEWLSSVLRRVPYDAVAPTLQPIPISAPRSAAPTPSGLPRTEPHAPARRGPALGEVLIGGRVELRMWAAGSVLVLATSPDLAAAVLRDLAADPDPNRGRDARRVLDAMRGGRAAAA